MKTQSLLAGAVIILGVLVQGCTLKPQYLQIDPPVRAKTDQIGSGKTVGLLVSDERSSKKLGEVGDPDRKMVDVFVEEDPSPAIYKRVEQALNKMGFKVQPYTDSSDSTLAITIKNLELQSEKRPLTFDTELRAEVAAHAESSASSYDRQFNVRTRRDGAAPPYRKDSAKLVNTALSQALEDLLSDEQLLALLAR